MQLFLIEIFFIRFEIDDFAFLSKRGAFDLKPPWV